MIKFLIDIRRNNKRFLHISYCMSYLEAFIMGLLQGLTEFLPVSSSGHLVLFSRITGKESSLFFDLILHLGTLLAVIVIFAGDIADIVRHPFSKKSRLLVLSTVCSAAVVFLIKDVVEETFDGTLLPFFFLITAVILFCCTYFSPRQKCENMGVIDAVIIGAAQGLAAFPGLSRSGLTASAGSFLGIRQKENASYCFLLSIPIILGSAVFEIIGGEFIFVPWDCLAIGFSTAFLSGLVSLKLLKKVFLKNRFDVFAVYLTVLSVFLLINDFWLHIF